MKNMVLIKEGGDFLNTMEICCGVVAECPKISTTLWVLYLWVLYLIISIYYASLWTLSLDTSSIPPIMGS